MNELTVKGMLRNGYSWWYEGVSIRRHVILKSGSSLRWVPRLEVQSGLRRDFTKL